MTLIEEPSTNVECYTPDEALEFVYKVFNDDVGLDPCADPRKRVKARRHFTKEDDGLSRMWDERRVFVNPPYGKGLMEWVKHGTAQSMSHAGCVLWLVPARTETEWAQHLLRYANAVCFPQGRYRFLGPDYTPMKAKDGSVGSPKFPNMWVLQGNYSEELYWFLRYGSDIGVVLKNKLA